MGTKERNQLTGERISSAVRALMAARGERQDHLASVLGIARTGVSDLLRGARVWTASDVEVIADHYGVDTAMLFDPPAFLCPPEKSSDYERVLPGQLSLSLADVLPFERRRAATVTPFPKRRSTLREAS